MDSALLETLRNPDTPFGMVDPVYAAYLLYGLIRGLFKGLPAELAETLGTLLTFWGAWKFHQPVSDAIRAHTRLDSPAGSEALAYALMVVLFLVCWRLLTLLLHKALDWTCPKQIRRAGGAVLGTAKAALLICVVLMAVKLSGHAHLREHLIERSAFGRAGMEAVPDTLHRWAPALFPATGPAEPDAADQADDDGS